MPYQVTLMEDEEWSVGLRADTPRSVLRSIRLRTYAHSTIVITRQWFPVDTLSAADLTALAVYAGRYMEQADGMLTLAGDGLLGHLGDAGDDGDLYTGGSGTTGALDLEAQLDARVFAFANGLTKGSVNSNSTTRDLNIVPGVSRRQWLDTIVTAYTDDWEYRVNPDGTIDVDTAATLWPSNTTPTTVLTDRGGREGAVTGLDAVLELDSIDVYDWRKKVTVRWNGTAGDNRTATNTVPAGWEGYNGATLERTTLADYDPRPQPERKRRWSIRRYANAVVAWAISSTTQASRMATRLANQAANVDYTVTARLSPDEFAPTRWLTAGDKAWVYDLDQDLYDTTNEVYYRGQVIHPLALRVQRMTCPIQRGMGVYLWTPDGWVDLTPYVEWEEDDTIVELGTRRRITPGRARPNRINRAALKRRTRQLAIFSARQQAAA